MPPGSVAERLTNENHINHKNRVDYTKSTRFLLCPAGKRAARGAAPYRFFFIFAIQTERLSQTVNRLGHIRCHSALDPGCSTATPAISSEFSLSNRMADYSFSILIPFFAKNSAAVFSNSPYVKNVALYRSAVSPLFNISSICGSSLILSSFS